MLPRPKGGGHAQELSESESYDRQAAHKQRLRSSSLQSLLEPSRLDISVAEVEAQEKLLKGRAAAWRGGEVGS